MIEILPAGETVPANSPAQASACADHRSSAAPRVSAHTAGQGHTLPAPPPRHQATRPATFYILWRCTKRPVHGRASTRYERARAPAWRHAQGVIVQANPCQRRAARSHRRPALSREADRWGLRNGQLPVSISCDASCRSSLPATPPAERNQPRRRLPRQPGPFRSPLATVADRTAACRSCDRSSR
jgi:hypothetical protein